MTLSTTDAKILDVLTEGRNLAVNITDRIETDQHRNYISRRLKKLSDDGYVRNVGRESTGLYELTSAGEQALEAYKEYNQKLEQVQAPSN